MRITVRDVARRLLHSVPSPRRLDCRQRAGRDDRTVFVEVPAQSERQTVRDTTSHLETSYAVSDARINDDGTLFHSLANKPRKRPVPTEKKVIYRDSIVYRDRANTEIVEVERKLTWWQQTKMKGFWVLLVVIAFVLRKNIVTLARRFI